MNAPTDSLKIVEPRLTSLSHGGGCGCKIAPGVLSEILKNSAGLLPKELLVGIERSEERRVGITSRFETIEVVFRLSFCSNASANFF